MFCCFSSTSRSRRLLKPRFSSSPRSKTLVYEFSESEINYLAKNNIINEKWKGLEGWTWCLPANGPLNDLHESSSKTKKAQKRSLRSRCFNPFEKRLSGLFSVLTWTLMIGMDGRPVRNLVSIGWRQDNKEITSSFPLFWIQRRILSFWSWLYRFQSVSKCVLLFVLFGVRQALLCYKNTF